MPQEAPKTLLIKDPIYGYCDLTDLERSIIQTTVFQRLRFITQNGLAFYTYPSLRTSRFEHSIGVCHLAGRVAKSIITHSDRETFRDFLCALVSDFAELLNPADHQELVAQISPPNGPHDDLNSTLSYEKACAFFDQLVRLTGLLHDLGHLPFSHLGEEAVEDHLDAILTPADMKEYRDLEDKIKLHEFMTLKLLRSPDEELTRAFGNQLYYLKCLQPLVLKPKEDLHKDTRALFWIKELIDSDVDVDRGDYLRRDGHNSGIGFGTYDIDRLVESVAVIKVKDYKGDDRFLVAPSDTSISTVETFLVERYKLHKWLYFHHSIRYLNYCLIRALRYLVDPRGHLGSEIQDKFKPEYFNHDRYVFKDGFICNEIWLWDVFYYALIVLKRKSYEAGLAMPIRASMKEAISYLEVIVRRAKMGFSLWKTHAEYLPFNRELKTALIGLKKKSDSLSRSRHIIGSTEINAIEERLFFNTVLSLLDPERRAQFEERFYREGVAVTATDVAGICDLPGIVESAVVGRLFIVLNKFIPFSQSKLRGTGGEPLSRFEFWVRRGEGGRRIRLSEVSKLVSSLEDAWKADIQAFCFFHSVDPDFAILAGKSIRMDMVDKMREIIVCQLVKWMEKTGTVCVVN